jgi:hypothetical protein
VSPRALDTLAA